jgi:hypothetical protein
VGTFRAPIRGLCCQVGSGRTPPRIAPQVAQTALFFTTCRDVTYAVLPPARTHLAPGAARTDHPTYASSRHPLERKYLLQARASGSRVTVPMTWNLPELPVSHAGASVLSFSAHVLMLQPGGSRDWLTMVISINERRLGLVMLGPSGCPKGIGRQPSGIVQVDANEAQYICS